MLKSLLRPAYLLRTSLLVLTLQLPCLAANAQQTAVLMENAAVIIGDGTLLDSASLLYRNGRIEAVTASEAADFDLPDDLTVIDLAGKTIMPAMIDAHAHLGYEAFTSWGADNYSRENLLGHLQRYAYYGFSAVFSAGSDPDELAFSLQREIEEGAVEGARFLIAAGMGPPGQGPNDQFLAQALTVAERTGMNILYGIANEQNALLAVREAAERGQRFIKIWVDDRGGSQQKLAPHLYRAIISEAHNLGLQVYVHQQNAGDMLDLLDAGTDGFLHGRIGSSFDSGLAKRTKQAGAFIVPNLGLGELRREAIGDDDFLTATLPLEVARRLSVAGGVRGQSSSGSPDSESEMAASFNALVDENVDVLLGTDAGAVPDHFFGYTGHRELEIFVRLGMQPMQALVSATSLPAQRLGLQDSGLIQAGYRADIVVLDESPLDDIRNTRTISRVIIAGKELDRESLAASFREE